MGIKDAWNRFKTNIQPVAESFASRYDGKNDRKPSVNLENVKSLEEYVKLYAEHLYSKEKEANRSFKSLDYRDVVEVYDELLRECMADKNSLIERMTKNFLAKVRWSCEKVWPGLLAGLYVLSKKHSFSYGWLLEEIIDFKYEISFESFNLVCEAAKIYNYDVRAAQKEIEDIWQKHFDKLIYNSHEESYAVLKKADREWGHAWGEYLYNKLIGFDWKKSTDWRYDYCSAKKIAHYYPELTPVAFKYLVLKFLYEHEAYCDCDDNDIDEISTHMKRYLQYINDCAENMSMEFEFKECWQTILKKVFILTNGRVLTDTIEMLNKASHISIEEMEKYVKCQVFYFLRGSSKATYNGNKLAYESDYCVEEIPFIERLKTIHRLLGNKTVFDVVKTENYAIIETFYYG